MAACTTTVLCFHFDIPKASSWSVRIGMGGIRRSVVALSNQEGRAPSRSRAAGSGDAPGEPKDPIELSEDKLRSVVRVESPSFFEPLD